jgi:hypothetical protein
MTNGPTPRGCDKALRWAFVHWNSVAIVAVTLAFAGISVSLAADSTSAMETEDASQLPAIEVIRERYPDGVVKIEREVTMDAGGNYVNHGAWRMWKRTGELVAEGHYELGKRVGPWTRTFDRDDAAVFKHRAIR